MSNRITSLFGIQYPVVMGAVAQTPELGAVVSNAGGLGCIAGALSSPEVLRERIQRFRELSDKPFSVNFPIVLTPEKDIEPKMRMMVEEKVPVVMTSAGNPKMWTSFLKEGGCRVAHVLPTVYHASKAVAAVLALGADGVQLGTRFMATTESESPDTFRQLVLAANDTSTMSAEGRVNPRVTRPEFAEAVLGEKKQVQMGQVAALIDEVKSVEAVMQNLYGAN